MAAHQCPRCKLDVPSGVAHRDAEDCLVHLAPRYRMLSRLCGSQRKQIDASTARTARLKEQVRIARGQVLAYVGPGHERRVAQLEQRMKFVLIEIEQIKAALGRGERKAA